MSDLEHHLRALGKEEKAPSPAVEERLIRGIPRDFSERHGLWDAKGVRIMFKMGAAAAVAVALIWAAVALFTPAGVGSSYAEMLRPVMRASGEAGAVHLVMHMRTREGEDFAYVNRGGPMQTVEVWIRWPRDAGDRGAMKIVKSDRVYDFDGKDVIHYLPPQREALRSAGGALDLGLFWPAAWVQKIIDTPPEGTKVTAREESRGRLVLRMKGKEVRGRDRAWFDEYDREVEILWDAATKRLTGFEQFVLVNGQRELFSELASVEYPPALSDDVFRLDLPAGIHWIEPLRPAGALDALGPRDAAARFWQAAIDGDWSTLSALCPSPAAIEWLKQNRPAEVLSLGEPFRTGTYVGTYVPYRVRFNNWPGARGSIVREQNLALRNDNPFKRWVFDGGI
jgi:hypothetical protein